MSPIAPNTLLCLLALGATATTQQPEFVEKQEAFTFKNDSSLGIDLTPLPTNYWSAAFASGHNATSSAQVKAYNMSQEYPGSPLPDDQPWEYTIKLLVKTSKSHLQPSPSNSSLLEIPQHPSWSACAVTFISSGWTQTEPLPGPGCSGFLSQDCIDELAKSLEEAYRNSTDNTFKNRVYNQCPLPVPDIMPRRCQPKGGVTGVGGALEQQRTVNGFVVRDQINGTYDWLKLAHVGNSTAGAYKQAVSQVYVVGHIWGYNGEAEVTCLKAEVVEGGVVDKPDNEEEKEDEEDDNGNNGGGGNGGGGNGTGNGNEGGNGNGNGNSGGGGSNPFENIAAMSLGLSTEGLCKLALAAVAVSFFSL
ncbi:hypothetical protein B0T21DRAFT_385806 [Apiosordaria backusii]|uniref:Uncharacterized protein n=1 Tax=Apiosordaria backusii TaxID=314023 RepID=A0AA40B2W6_9PEZI|nr:hypothetical protein B0T21DRAFT_385806 [Apiosordaria backusii]